MRKIFALIVSSVTAVLGVVSLIDAINLLQKLGSVSGYVEKYYKSSAIIEIGFFALTLGFLIATFICVFKYKNVGHAASYAVASLATFGLFQGLASMAYWNALQSATGVKQEEITVAMVSMIIGFVCGGCLLLACIDHMPLRKLFGIVGAVIGIVLFGIACFGLNGASTLQKIVIIGGLITFILGFILTLAIPKKDKKVEAK